MLLGKSESELSDDFAFSKVITANIELMFDAYEYHQFGIEHPEEERQYWRGKCPQMYVRPGFITPISRNRVQVKHGNSTDGRTDEWEWVHWYDPTPSRLR